MASKKHVEMWSDVVSGSTLEISVKGTAKDAFIVATVEHRVAPAKKGDPGKIKTVLDTSKGAPLVVPLKTPNIYSADGIVAFMTDAEAKVRAVVRTPSGKQFGDALEETVSAKTGGTARFSLLVITA